MKTALFVLGILIFVIGGLTAGGCFFPEDVAAPPTPPPGDGTCNPGELMPMSFPYTVSAADIPEGKMDVNLRTVPNMLDLSNARILKMTTNRTGNTITITVEVQPEGRIR